MQATVALSSIVAGSTVRESIDCTRNGIGNAAYIVIRDVIGHPPYGHGAREIGGSHE